ncbi:putative cyclin-B3-1 [Ranunculus cassubicifolius]
MEAQYPFLSNYMTSQTCVTPKMRGILVNWLIEVHLKFRLMPETLFLMVSLFDRFLSVVTIERNEVQLVGLTALLLASKYEDFWHPKVKDLISISLESYTREKMLKMEKLMLKKLMFRLNIPTSYVFMLRFLKAAQSDSKLENLAFYLIELCLIEYDALKYKPSLLCASAIYVAKCTLRMSPAWTPLLCKHTHYEECDLRECGEMILRFHRGSGKGQLKVSHEKYMHPDQKCVAEIKALSRLP